MTRVLPLRETVPETPERPYQGGRAAMVVGELLVTIGVLAALYVVWQLWWTSAEVTPQAQAVVQEFEQSLPPAPDVTASLRHDDPPAAPQADPGEVYGVLIVPSWYGKTNNAMPIAEGTTSNELDRAYAGHYTQTQDVGEVGNFALAGHRRTYGNSFRYVPDLREGDQVIVETRDAWYVYAVTDYELVLPEDVDVIAPVPGRPGVQPTERTLTLTTCHSPTLGAYGNSHRWITHAQLVGWMDRADGKPEQVRSIPEVG